MIRLRATQASKGQEHKPAPACVCCAEHRTSQAACMWVVHISWCVRAPTTVCASTPLMKMGTGMTPSCSAGRTQAVQSDPPAALRPQVPNRAPSKQAAGPPPPFPAALAGRLADEPPHLPSHLLHERDELQDVRLLRDHVLAVQQYAHHRGARAAQRALPLVPALMVSRQGTSTCAKGCKAWPSRVQCAALTTTTHASFPHHAWPKQATHHFM